MAFPLKHRQRIFPASSKYSLTYEYAVFFRGFRGKFVGIVVAMDARGPSNDKKIKACCRIQEAERCIIHLRRLPRKEFQRSQSYRPPHTVQKKLYIMGRISTDLPTGEELHQMPRLAGIHTSQRHTAQNILTSENNSSDILGSTSLDSATFSPDMTSNDDTTQQNSRSIDGRRQIRRTTRISRYQVRTEVKERSLLDC